MGGGHSGSRAQAPWAVGMRAVVATALARSPLAWVLLGVLGAYRLLVSPLLGQRCRFEPSCSRYAAEAIATHGAARGGWLALRRLARCHPWGGAGIDPVPPRPIVHAGHSRGALRVDHR